MITQADRDAISATISEARGALDRVEADVNNADNTIRFTGAIVASQALAAAVAKLVAQVGHEWGETQPS